MTEMQCRNCGTFIKVQDGQKQFFCGKCGTKQSLVQTEEQQGFYNKKIMVVSGSNVTNGDSMIKRGYMSLEDHDWNSANDFFEAALNLNAEDGEAYLGKFLVKQKSQSIQELFAKLEQNTELVSDKEKRFFIGQDEEEFASHIEEQIKEKMIPNYLEETRIRCLYKYVQSYESNWKGRLHQKETALTLFEDRDYKRAIKYLPEEQLKLLNEAWDDYMQLLDNRIADAKEEDDRFVETEKQKYADFLRTQDEILEDEYQRAFEKRADEYQRGVDLLDDARTIEDFWNLISIFERMEGYKDSADLLKNCRETLAELEEQRRLEQEQERIRLEEERVAKQKATRRKRIIITGTTALVLFSVISWVYVIHPFIKYRSAKNLREAHKYDEAVKIYEELGDYKDSLDLIGVTIEEKEEYCLSQQYQSALAFRAAGNYEEAVKIFLELGDYSDSAEQIYETKYQKALALGKEGDYDSAVTILQSLGDYSDSKEQIYEAKYRKAMLLKEKEDYEEAIAIFRELGDYKDSADNVEQCMTAWKDPGFQKAERLFNKKKYEEALTIYESLGNYKDSAEKVKSCKEEIKELKYQEAERLQKNEQYDEAIAIYQELGNYKDVEDCISEKKEKELTQCRNAKEGDTVTFGNYHGSTEWIVLEKEGNQLLLLSKEGIALMAYYEWDESVTWEGCTLRTWLNYDYISDAFSEEEQNMIQSTWISNEDNPEYGTEGGNDTFDKVFLLSIEEVERYFSSDEERECMLSAYANARRIAVTNNTNYNIGIGWRWLLRSPGAGSGRVANVEMHGSVDYWGSYVNDSWGTVRPALWINLDS